MTDLETHQRHLRFKLMFNEIGLKNILTQLKTMHVTYQEELDEQIRLAIENAEKALEMVEKMKGENK